MIDFPDKRYDIIYADPPWHFSRGMKSGKNDEPWIDTPDKHYPTMSISELCDLPVESIASENCLLFMWIVSTFLPDTIDVGKSWGFEYKSVAFIWHKDAQPLAGYYTMAQCEQCFVFKRGKIPEPRGARNIHQLLYEPEFVRIRRGKHSQKPIQIRERITKMFPNQSKIELFARINWTDQGKGWDFWGNEVNSYV